MNYLALGVALRDGMSQYHDRTIKETADATAEQAIAGYLAVIASNNYRTFTNAEWIRHAEWLNFAKEKTIQFLADNRDACEGVINYRLESLYEYYISFPEYFKNTLNDIRKISGTKKESQ